MTGPLVVPRVRQTALFVLLAVAAPSALQAQASFDVRPVVARTDGDRVSLGARWSGAIEPGKRTSLKLKFPHELWWGVRGTGAWLSRETASPEPLIDADAEFGMQWLLLEQRDCAPGNCPPADSIVKFDFGYVVIGARLQGETDGNVIETMGAVGGVLLYRPPSQWSVKGLGFLVPTLSFGISSARPLRSALRESLNVENERFTRTDLALGWTFRFGRDWVPGALRPVRLDAHLAHFTHGDLEQPIVDSVGTSGRFVAFDVGYDLPARTRYLRHLFLRWSEGEHATLPTGRKGWLLGVTLGSERPHLP